MTNEPKKLSEQELAEIRQWSGYDTVFGIEDLAEIHVKELLGHIDAITAEHAAEMTRAREDADRVGAARIAFEDEQTKRIEALENSLLNHAGLISNAETVIIQQLNQIKELKADLQQAIMPGWQTYEQWLANGRKIPDEWRKRWDENANGPGCDA